jgi:hypothetical protein
LVGDGIELRGKAVDVRQGHLLNRLDYEVQSADH